MKFKPTTYKNVLLKAEKTFIPNLPSGLNFYKAGASRELITQKVKVVIEWGKKWNEEFEIMTTKNNARWIRTNGETELVDCRLPLSKCTWHG